MLDDAAAEAVGTWYSRSMVAVRSDFALSGRGEHDALLRGHQVFELLDEGGNGAVEAQRGPRVHRDLAERVVVFEHIDGAELIEIEAVMRVERAPAEFQGEDRCLRAG